MRSKADISQLNLPHGKAAENISHKELLFAASCIFVQNMTDNLQ